MRLLEGVEVRRIAGETRKEIQGIAYHSRQVSKDFLFAAIRGLEADGHRFIDEAIERGAEAILLEEGPVVSGPTAIFVPNSRQALAKVASTFYGNPSAKMRLVGIIGTNGKTTTTYLIESILKKAGFDVGVIGTINYRYNQKVVPALNTTPESLDIAPSLGGIETLLTRPATTSHAGLSPEERHRLGISDALIRMSVGIEAAEDIIEDFKQALEL